MIQKLIDFLFKWDSLRVAIFSEVDWHNSITRTLNDPESMEPAAAMWSEEDGWRGWNKKENGNYYFHDIPEKGLSDLMDILLERKTYA